MKRFTSTRLRLSLSILLIISIQPWCVSVQLFQYIRWFHPLNDLGLGTYNCRQGGLYLNGLNTRPFAHENAGVQQARSSVLSHQRTTEPEWQDRYTVDRNV